MLYSPKPYYSPLSLDGINVSDATLKRIQNQYEDSTEISVRVLSHNMGSVLANLDTFLLADAIFRNKIRSNVVEITTSMTNYILTKLRDLFSLVEGDIGTSNNATLMIQFLSCTDKSISSDVAGLPDLNVAMDDLFIHIKKVSVQTNILDKRLGKIDLRNDSIDNVAEIVIKVVTNVKFLQAEYSALKRRNISETCLSRSLLDICEASVSLDQILKLLLDTLDELISIGKCLNMDKFWKRTYSQAYDSLYDIHDIHVAHSLTLSNDNDGSCNQLNAARYRTIVQQNISTMSTLLSRYSTCIISGKLLLEQIVRWSTGLSFDVGGNLLSGTSTASTILQQLDLNSIELEKIKIGFLRGQNTCRNLLDYFHGTDVTNMMLNVDGILNVIEQQVIAGLRLRINQQEQVSRSIYINALMFLHRLYQTFPSIQSNIEKYTRNWNVWRRPVALYSTEQVGISLSSCH